MCEASYGDKILGDLSVTESEIAQGDGAKLIQNFGIRWRRDYVNFGRPGPGGKGQLQGFLATEKVKEREQIDFWDQTGVYAL